MERIRKPLQGVKNIIRFNWHFYLLSFGLISIIFLLNSFFNEPYLIFSKILYLLIVVNTLASILISFYIYDLSDLYKLKWLDDVPIVTKGQIVNIHSGFDETSILLQEKFPDAGLSVLDFYDPSKHTEVSIKRARKTYPSYENTIRVDTRNLTLNDNCADNIFVILAAHEIRNGNERNDFFVELRRVLKHEGSIIVVEHLRDIPNFLAYAVGFFHFMPRSSWYKAFKNADLNVSNQFRITPFITVFLLEKHGFKP